MFGFHHVDRRRALTVESRDPRLSRTWAGVVIAVLSALCWAVLISFVFAIWSAL